MARKKRRTPAFPRGKKNTRALELPIRYRVTTFDVFHQEVFPECTASTVYTILDRMTARTKEELDVLPLAKAPLGPRTMRTSRFYYYPTRACTRAFGLPDSAAGPPSFQGLCEAIAMLRFVFVHANGMNRASARELLLGELGLTLAGDSESRFRESFGGHRSERFWLERRPDATVNRVGYLLPDYKTDPRAFATKVEAAFETLRELEEKSELVREATRQGRLAVSIVTVDPIRAAEIRRQLVEAVGEEAVAATVEIVSDENYGRLVLCKRLKRQKGES